MPYHDPANTSPDDSRFFSPEKSARQKTVWEDAFLVALAETGNATEAARCVGIDRRTAYYLRTNPDAQDFAQAWDEAIQEAADHLEREARRRAVEGTAEPVYYKGEQVGAIQRFSDTLLIFLLKGARPEKYAEWRVNKNENTNVHKVDDSFERALATVYGATSP
jgi:hypothetical protein